MLLAIISDTLIALVSAFLIIYALVFSVYCIFLSDNGEIFSFKKTLEKLDGLNRKEEKCQKNP